ncbi:MAG: UDP-glucose/GDP-mannose dehydrogenase family protein [Pseudonocardia sp.]|uniref:UDP-glucose dehydrogenase family protein n=1 Tax=unclassified Pseudonocardia TaxID=2619320 RepID=UPI00086844F6|nr:MULTISPECIES: UDP-glucose/GDP-mannose dehydrogenase family protein [unclassified Pseudonocardia]MBN9111932.1 UDP-glucose/GDP-mannose dehydrogenase family protein [Pseudonocardia sp.]ODU24685.1 MAG: UDP-glucose 6-dehydrogenase [Pseudonocardia sp. SCN 72-51]ODV06722.1 MAG: UDP-glucose 6-dehydrogenase [Pseudonocardia sp. SCN 73-27]
MFGRRVVVVGAGYVGLTTAACLASLGHRVVCADVDAVKIERLRHAEIGIREERLAELVGEGLAARRLSFVVGAGIALKELEADDGPAEVVFLCVPTPMGVGGVADLGAVEAVIEEIRDDLPAGAVVVNKSTVPVGTAARTAEMLDRPDVAVVSNPEFLREGSAVEDFLTPDRVVVGSADQDAAALVAALFTRLGAPAVLTDAASAEMIKYAANCFLAMKLSYVNALAELCERLDADIHAVTEGIGYDRRIGQAFLDPGPGWGGSCLPKDTHALLQVADSVDFEFRLLRASIDTNTRQFQRIVDKVRTAVTGTRSGSLARRRLALFGLAFKAGTDDVRDSPALRVAALLRQAGAELAGHDPAVTPGTPGIDPAVVSVCADPYEAARGADAGVVLTEWPEYRTLDWARLAGLVGRPVVVDTRNLLDPAVVELAGFAWSGLGARQPAQR